MTTPVFRRQPVLVMETGINQVPGGAQAGWVSGNPSGLADGASVTIVFDLGPDWDQYTTVALTVRPQGGTSLSSIQCTGNDTAVFTPYRRLKEALASGTGNTSFTINTSSDGLQFYIRPMGRYVMVNTTNTAGGGAMGASKVTLAAYPA